MSTFTIVALVILPILGGFIAWAGDVIGYRLGKSRRTMLGLRPRTTARVIAIVVGVLLPAVTMFVAAVGSENVRMALFRRTELRRSVTQLKVENQQLATSRDASVVQKENAQRQYDEARTLLAEAQTGLSQARSSLGQARGELTTARAEREKLASQVSGLVEIRKKLAADLKETQGDLGIAVSAKGEAERLEREANTRLVAADARIADLQVKEDQLQRTVSDWKTREEQASLRVAQAERDLLSTSQELAAKRHEVEVATELRDTVLAAWKHREEATAGPVRYEPGTELMRATIDARQSLDQIEVSLRELVVIASKRAMVAGVEPEEGDSAVRLIAPLPPDTGSELPDPDEIIRLTAETIRRGREPDWVAVVSVFLRSFVGDKRPVAAGLFVRPNTLIYPQGTAIVHLDIDGGRPRAEVFKRLLGLLTDLRNASEQAGLMADPKTGQYGQVPAESILQTLDDLLGRKQQLQVDAVAAGDVYVASDEPFTVLLKVAPAEEPPGG